MASGLARELNNIFAIILGKSRLLLARTNNEPLREGLATLEEAAWRGADVVHRMVALAAPASDAAASPVDVVALVRDVIALTQPRWKEEQKGPAAASTWSSTCTACARCVGASRPCARCW